MDDNQHNKTPPSGHTAQAIAPTPSTTEHQVTRKEVRTAVSSSAIGTSIEWYDFFLYGTAAGLVFDKLYFPSDDPLIATLLAYATFAVGFVARPLGGLIFGHLGDRIGRKKTLVTTMYIMGIATFLIGAIPTYDQIGFWAPFLLVILRIAQGIAIGGEWGGAVLLSVEYAPKNRRGFFGSFPQMGIAFGLLLGTGAFTLLNFVMDDEAFLSWGWRISFFASILLVIVGLYLRSRIAETPAFRAARASVDELEQAVPLKELFKDRLSRRHMLLGMGTRYAEGVSYNLWAVFLISFTTGTVGFSNTEMLISLMVAAVVLGIFIPLWGRVSDSLPRRGVYAAGAVLLALSVFPAFAAIQTGSWLVLTVTLVVVLGIIHPMMYGPQAAFYAELFPPSTRYSGISIVYQISGIVAGGLTPMILTWLLGLGGLSMALSYVIATCVVTVLCTWAIRPRDIKTVLGNEKDVQVKVN
jgi:metabolite-proton symporter